MKRFFSSNPKPSDKKMAKKSEEKDQKDSTADESERTVAATDLPPNLLGVLDNASNTSLVFGRYEVQRSLGSGGYGEVYLGHDAQLDRPVAIKVVRSKPHQKQTEDNISLQEARKLARLRHPGIVTVHDVGIQGDQF